MAKKNIGATPALYPCPLTVIGAMADGKPTWTLVAHAGVMAHSHLMVSLVQAHYINRGIRENKRLSVNIVDESWLAAADKTGTVSGNQVDKSGLFAWTMGEHGAAPSAWFSHLAIEAAGEETGTEWLEAVGDEVYSGLK